MPTVIQKEQIEITLKYEGPDVDDGSMSVEDIVPVLEGFSSAYRKLAAIEDPATEHRIKISAVRPGSADLILKAWKLVQDNAPAMDATMAAGNVGITIVRNIVRLMRAKKHVRNQPYSGQIVNHGGIVLSNCDNVKVEFPKEVVELLRNRLLDIELNKIVAPLRDGHIQRAEVAVSTGDGLISESVTVGEKEYFQTEEPVLIRTEETVLPVSLNSYTKSTKSGYLYTSGSARIFFVYVGDDPEKMLRLFVEKGVLQARCIAHLTADLKTEKLEILDAWKAQGTLLA